MTSGDPTLAIMVVAFKSESFLQRCLKSACEQAKWVILLDNGGMSRDYQDELRRLFPDVLYVPFLSNLGFALGNQAAWEVASKLPVRFIGLLNPDAWIEPFCWKRILEAFQMNPSFGILSPVQLTYEEGTALAEWTCKMLKVSSIDQIREFSSPIKVPWVEGSALFVRREILDQLGLFDEVFDMYFEEVDLCRRARLSGWDVGVVPSGFYHHAVGASLGGKEAPIRQLRKDLGQLLYVVTDPGRSRLRNGIEVLRLLGRRATLWARGSYPLFPQFVVQGAMVLIRKHRLIKAKWHRERRHQLHRESR